MNFYHRMATPHKNWKPETGNYQFSSLFCKEENLVRGLTKKIREIFKLNHCFLGGKL